MNEKQRTSEMASDGIETGVGRVGGVDGAAGGWVMAITDATDGAEVEFSLWTSFDELWAQARRQSLVAVGIDMPIGLPSTARRPSDVDARALLGPRRSSLFWSPPAAALDASDYSEANRAAREHLGMGLSKQAYNLLPKIREVRAALSPADFAAGAVPCAAEVHPELSFAAMAATLRMATSSGQSDNPISDGEQATASEPLQHPKRYQAGIAERLTLLSSCYARITESAVLEPLVGPPHPTLDDLLDAAAAAWTARRVAAGRATHLGSSVERVQTDGAGFPLGIVV